jgi:hypothetical protein
MYGLVGKTKHPMADVIMMQEVSKLHTNKVCTCRLHFSNSITNETLFNCRFQHRHTAKG